MLKLSFRGVHVLIRAPLHFPGFVAVDGVFAWVEQHIRCVKKNIVLHVYRGGPPNSMMRWYI